MERKDNYQCKARLKNFIEKNKRNIIIISAVIFVAALFGTMYAFFSDIVKATSVIKSGFVSVKLVEEAPFDGETVISEEGADTNIKIFRAVSEGSLDAYVRAKILPVVEYFDAEEDSWVVANIPVSDIRLDITADEWVESEGYYYYKNILLAGDESEDVTVTITEINIPDSLKSEQIRATIKVILESAQVDYEAWKGIFNIANLPDDVEVSRAKSNDAKLVQGMIPVVYDSNKGKWVKTTFTNLDWYDYNAGKWANVMLQDGVEYDSDGETILKTGSMFVWIPRYAYKITYYDTQANREAAYTGSTDGIIGYSDTRGIVDINGIENYTFSRTYGKIDIVFLDGNTNKYTTSEKIQKEASEDNYIVHPAFRNNPENGGWDKELTGIWIAKYNASMADSSMQNIETTSAGVGNTTNGIVRTVADNTAWRYVNIDNIFKICRNMEKTNVYGWNAQSGALQADGSILGDNNRIDTHLIKNNEWGAVTYLTEAKGRGTNRSNPKIGRNSDPSYITGKGGLTATTTGNEYGIYDLCGCAWEYTAGYYDYGNGLNTHGSSLYNSSSKYKTVFTPGASAEESYYNARNKKGEAVFETSFNSTSWYSEHAITPTSGSPFFLRGGFYGDGAAGTFCFYSLSGAGESYYSFRPAIVVE